MSGWWLTNPEKYEFVSWDDDISNMMGQINKNNPHVPNHQPVIKWSHISSPPSQSMVSGLP
jgi:hypothetical protein